ncbi:MAG: alpha/beta fold hydrolase [Gemmobacter sp.]|nr:alpha/beta fold hydrolase [Gemmobacter sp.]
MLAHPVGLDQTFWGGLSDALASHHTVVAVDLRGHGGSEDAARPGQMAAYRDDLVTLIETLGLGPATLIGVSFGGMIAQTIACDRPDLVAGLVLAACPGAMLEAARTAILQRGVDAELGGMASILEATLARWFTPAAPAALVDRVRGRLLANAPTNWAAAWEAISGHNALPRLPAVRCPALVIAGELDVATPVEATRALAAAIPGSRHEVMNGAPHMLQLECEARFAALVQHFLRGTA